MLRDGSLAQGQKHKEPLASPSVTETEACLRALSEAISVATMGSGPRGLARDTSSGVRLTPHVPAHVGFNPSSPVFSHHSQGGHFPKAAQHPSPFPAWSHIVPSGSTQEKSPGVSEGTSQTKQLRKQRSTLGTPGSLFLHEEKHSKHCGNVTLAQDLPAPVAVPAQMCLPRSTIPTSARTFQTNVQEAFSAGDTTAPPSCWPPRAVPAVLYGFPAQSPDLGEPGENLNKK